MGLQTGNASNPEHPNRNDGPERGPALGWGHGDGGTVQATDATVARPK